MQKPKNKQIKAFVAMSGGVDSSVTAALLKERGFSAEGGPASGWDVCGVHIKMWSDPSIPCNFREDRYAALKVARKLGIPFQTWDLTEEYRKEVVEYMVREYASGRTPNPDVMCNSRIKFGVFLKRALEQGADYIATGHYTKLQIANDKLQKRYKLLQAKDKNKDQSYFLWTLTQQQLKHCLFPIGEYTKPEVRELARKFGLPTAEKPDSQGICFIGEIDIKEFLKKYIPARPGPVLTTSGKKIGEHDGLAFYTIGQREGLGVGGGIPYYVAQKDFAQNTLLVAEGPYDERLFSPEVKMSEVNWISGQGPKMPLRCEARIRYRQPLQKCTIISTNSESNTNKRINESSRIRKFVNSEKIRYSLMISFDEPQRAVTPGQSIVFYKGQEMLGGGVIV